MNSKNILRFVEYIFGLIVMATGIMLMRKAVLGITPISSIPLAVSEVVPGLTFGVCTMLFQAICTVAVILVEGKITIKTILMFPMGVVFGSFLDLLAIILSFSVDHIVLRFGILLAGMAVQAFGIATINHADLMLPSPDALLRSLSARTGKDYPVIKIAGDCVWIVIASAIELVFLHKLQAVFIGTFIAALLTGRIIRFWNRTVFDSAGKD